MIEKCIYSDTVHMFAQISFQCFKIIHTQYPVILTENIWPPGPQVGHTITMDNRLEELSLQ